MRYHARCCLKWWMDCSLGFHDTYVSWNPREQSTCHYRQHSIISLSWNTSGRILLSSATDWNIILWGVVYGEAKLCLRFPVLPHHKSPVQSERQGDIPHCLMKHIPTLMTLKDREPETSMTRSFDPLGKQIIIGNSKGKVWHHNDVMSTSLSIIRLYHHLFLYYLTGYHYWH